jgi:hypothetical protein
LGVGSWTELYVRGDGHCRMMVLYVTKLGFHALI